MQMEDVININTYNNSQKMTVTIPAIEIFSLHISKNKIYHFIDAEKNVVLLMLYSAGAI
jgi:TRAP-type uncharacterized transport system substrate-binding protein